MPGDAPQSGSYPNRLQIAGISARGLVSRSYFYGHIGVELVGSWQYGASGGVGNAGILAQLIGWKVKAVSPFLAWC